MNIDRIIYTLGALCAVLLGIDFIYHRHAYTELEAIPGFYAAAGFLLPAALLLGGVILKFLFGRDEDYYGNKDVSAETYPKDQVEAGNTTKKGEKK